MCNAHRTVFKLLMSVWTILVDVCGLIYPISFWPRHTQAPATCAKVVRVVNLKRTRNCDFNHWASSRQLVSSLAVRFARGAVPRQRPCRVLHWRRCHAARGDRLLVRQRRSNRRSAYKRREKREGRDDAARPFAAPPCGQQTTSRLID